MRRIAFYGGSFDPVHNGHLAIARNLLEQFRLDYFYFVPAFHAPHKKDKKVTSPFCRYAMLALATAAEPQIKISTIELEAPEKPYTIETIEKLEKHYARQQAQIFFVMGADSWNEIDSWRDWQKLLFLTNIVVVTRPNFEIEIDHVTPEIKRKIQDLRGLPKPRIAVKTEEAGIFITDAVFLDVSATGIRREIASQKGVEWRKLVAPEVANYIEKYKLYS